MVSRPREYIDWVIGVDDGYFPHYFKSMRGSAPLVGVLGRGPFARDIETVLVLVDIDDLSREVIEIVERLLERNRDIEVSSVVTDSVVFAGFSVYDPWRVYRETGLPIVVLFSHPLDLERIRSALEKHFPDHRKRYEIIEKAYRASLQVSTPRGLLRALCIGVSEESCIKNIIEHQTFHKYPQPLVVADVVASAIGRFLSESSSLEESSLD